MRKVTSVSARIMCSLAALWIAVLPARALPPGMDGVLNRVNAPMMAWRTVKYKADGRETLSFHPAPGDRDAPIVIIVDQFEQLEDAESYSLGWLPSFLSDEGFALGVVSHRSDQRPKLAQAAATRVQGIAELVARAEELGFDPRKIILLGQGWGGGLATLLGTDPTYLNSAGVPFEAVKAVAVLDGDGFDISSMFAAGSEFRKKEIERWIGSGDSEQRKLSAFHHADPPNAPRFLFHAVKSKDDSIAQAEAMAAAVRTGGSAAEVKLVDRSRWKSNETYIGGPSNRNNAALLRFLRDAVR